MCRYRRSIWQCNHARLSPEPFLVCAAQQAYISGESTSPCGVAESHTCSTVRFWHLCSNCEDKKTALDGRLSEAKSKMAELRKHLDESYGDCMKRVDEASPNRSRSGSEENNDKDGKSKENAVDPVQAFLKKIRSEKHAHLMMLGAA